MSTIQETVVTSMKSSTKAILACFYIIIFILGLMVGNSYVALYRDMYPQLQESTQ